MLHLEGLRLSSGPHVLFPVQKQERSLWGMTRTLQVLQARSRKAFSCLFLFWIRNRLVDNLALQVHIPSLAGVFCQFWMDHQLSEALQNFKLVGRRGPCCWCSTTSSNTVNAQNTQASPFLSDTNTVFRKAKKNEAGTFASAGTGETPIYVGWVSPQPFYTEELLSLTSSSWIKEQSPDYLTESYTKNVNTSWSARLFVGQCKKLSHYLADSCTACYLFTKILYIRS